MRPRKPNTFRDDWPLWLVVVALLSYAVAGEAAPVEDNLPPLRLLQVPMYCRAIIYDAEPAKGGDYLFPRKIQLHCDEGSLDFGQPPLFRPALQRKPDDKCLGCHPITRRTV